MIIKTSVSGGHVKHSRHPWERDTTRGTPNLDGCPSLHVKELKTTLKIATCQCCGADFGYEISEPTVPAYCSAHRWLGQKRRLGVPLLNGIIYRDHKTALEVDGRNVRWSYCFLEDDPKCREKLTEALNAFIESQESLRKPTVVPTSKAVMVMDLQRFAWGDHSDIDNPKLSRVFDQLDGVYIEAL